MDVYDYTRPASMCHVRGYHRHVQSRVSAELFQLCNSRIEDIRFSFSKFGTNAAEKIDILSQHETMPITRTDAWHLLLRETVARWKKRSELKTSASEFSY